MNQTYLSIGIAVLSGVTSFALINSVSVNAAPQGDKIYKMQCAVCHPGGKNMSDPKKPVIGSKKLKDKETFKAFLSKSQGSMPAFEKVANNDAALTALYDYVKALK